MTVLFALVIGAAAAYLGYRRRPTSQENTAGRMAFAFGTAFVGRIVGFFANGVGEHFSLGPFGPSAVVHFGQGIESFTAVFGASVVVAALLGGAGRKARVVWALLIVAGLVRRLTVTLSKSDGLGPVFFAPLALPTGWTKRVRGGTRIGLALLLFLYSFTTIISRSWPSEMATSFLWATKVLHAPAMFLLGLHGLIASIRLAVGFRIEVRKIGRRLLVSHLLAIVVPTLLAVCFSLLLALVSIAAYRAESAKRDLSRQKVAVEAALGRAIRESLVSPGGWASDPNRAADGMRALFEEPPGGTAIILSRVDSAAAPSLLALSLSDTAREEQTRAPVEGDPEAWVLPTRNWLDRSTTDTPIVFAEGKIFLVARASVPEADGGTAVRADLVREIPFGRIREVERTLGAPARINPLVRISSSGSGVQISGVDKESREKAQADRADWEERGLKANEEDDVVHGWMPGATLVEIQFFDDEEGAWAERLGVLGSRAAPRDLISGVTSWENNRLSLVPLTALIILAILFLMVVAAVLGTVIQMNRSIATAVGRLTKGTRRLRDGDLEHRIEVEGEDELAKLGGEFNRMAEGLEEGRRLAIEKERVEQELAIAQEIQRKLLPESPPSIPGLEVAGVSIPAREVGGDYFDFLVLADGSLAAIIADVSGKGVPAALLMSSLRASLHAGADGGLDPAPTAARLNGFVYASTKSENFITGLLGIVSARTGEVRFANAGHEPPMILRVDGSVDAVPGGGLMLGAFPEAPYEEIRFVLGPGELMLLYTDGVTEAMNRESEFFGEDRLRRALAATTGIPAKQVLDELIRQTKTFTDGAEASDDITLVAVRRLAP